MYHLDKIRHVGNLGWALLRKQTQAAGGKANDIEEEELVKRAKEAVLAQCATRVVILVHLHVSQESTLRRRQKDSRNCRRVPMKNEEAECNELYDLLDASVEKHLIILKELGIPTLVIDNSKDGDDCLDATTAKIIKFIHKHVWRCAVTVR